MAAAEHVVTGCADCPMQGLVEFQYGSQAICQHPASRIVADHWRAVADEDAPAPAGPPEWCPLLKEPLLIKIVSRK